MPYKIDRSNGQQVTAVWCRVPVRKGSNHKPYTMFVKAYIVNDGTPDGFVQSFRDTIRTVDMMGYYHAADTIIDMMEVVDFETTKDKHGKIYHYGHNKQLPAKFYQEWPNIN